MMQTDLCAHTSLCSPQHIGLHGWGPDHVIWRWLNLLRARNVKSVLYVRAVKNSSEKAVLSWMPSLILSRKNIVTTFVTLGLSSLSSGTKTRLSSFLSKYTSLLPNWTIMFWNAHFSKQLFCKYHLHQHLGGIFISLYLYVEILLPWENGSS